MSSHEPARLDLRIPIRAKFPSEHIQALGFGEVGRVYLKFAADSAIIRAEADLIAAPYKQMIIDDPDILRIFGERGDAIDMKVLHPAAKFRLEPLEIIVDEEGELDMTSFDTGRLVNTTQLPATARYGRSQKHLLDAEPTGEGAVHKRVRETFASRSVKNPGRRPGKKPSNGTSSAANSVRAPQRSTLSKAVEAAIDIPKEPTPRQDNAEELETRQQKKGPAQIVLLKLAPRVSQPPSAALNPSEPKVTKPQRAMQVLQQIMNGLPDDPRATYNHFVTVTRKQVAKDEEKKRDFHQELGDFILQHDIVEQHNTYANLLKASGTNKAFQLPEFENGDIVAS